jgi:hypothetical protein
MALAVAIASAAPALAQHRGLSGYHPKPTSAPGKSNEEILADVRRAANQNIPQFGVTAAPKEKPFPWIAMGLALTAGVIATPFGYRMYKSTRAALEDQSTFGLKSGRRSESAAAGKAAGDASARKRPPARGAGETRIIDTGKVAERSLPGAASARDAIWDAMASANAWVSVDWVASTVGFSATEVAEEIRVLEEEGYLKENRDKSGKPVFRVNG